MYKPHLERILHSNKSKIMKLFLIHILQNYQIFFWILDMFLIISLSV